MNPDGRNQIHALPSNVASSIRASQIIGSFPRAIEELVHNSILHGCARSVTVTVGKKESAGGFEKDTMTEICVIDDGLGIDADATRNFIGTEYCSNDANGTVHLNDTEGCQNKMLDQRGETLKSIAALCMEMKVETASWVSRKSYSQDNFEGGYLMRSTKIIREGSVVSFEASSDNNSGSSSIIPKSCTSTQSSFVQSRIKRSDRNHASTGTTVTIKGLFHRHVVRRKQHLLENMEKKRGNNTSSESAIYAQVRACLRFLSISYPLITFQFLHDGKKDFSCMAPSWAQSFTGPLSCRATSVASPTSPSLSDESRALVARLGDIYGNKFSSDSCKPFDVEECQLGSNFSKNKLAGSLRAFGVICLPNIDEGDATRSREFEIIAINGRIATHGNKIADLIQNLIQHSRGNNPRECLNIG